MEKINRKYVEDFNKLVRDWERLKLRPNPENLNQVMQDLQQIQSDLRNFEIL